MIYHPFSFIVRKKKKECSNARIKKSQSVNPYFTASLLSFEIKEKENCHGLRKS